MEYFSLHAAYARSHTISIVTLIPKFPACWIPAFQLKECRCWIFWEAYNRPAYFAHLLHCSHPLQSLLLLLSAPRPLQSFLLPTRPPTSIAGHPRILHIYIHTHTHRSPLGPCIQQPLRACLFALMSEVCRPHIQSLFIAEERGFRVKSLIEQFLDFGAFLTWAVFFWDSSPVSHTQRSDSI